MLTYCVIKDSRTGGPALPEQVSPNCEETWPISIDTSSILYSRHCMYPCSAYTLPHGDTYAVFEYTVGCLYRLTYDYSDTSSTHILLGSSIYQSKLLEGKSFEKYIHVHVWLYSYLTDIDPASKEVGGGITYQRDSTSLRDEWKFNPWQENIRNTNLTSTTFHLVLQASLHPPKGRGSKQIPTPPKGGGGEQASLCPTWGGGEQASLHPPKGRGEQASLRPPNIRYYDSPCAVSFQQ